MFDIKIDTKLKVDVGGVSRMMKIKNQTAIREIVDKGISVIRRESPVASGVFRLSVKRLDEKGSNSEDGSSERSIRIGPSIYYSKFVLNKTRASQGRYFPTFDVRLRGGVHPGTPANPVLNRAKIKLRPQITAILKKHYGEGSFELTRFIR